LRGYEDEFGLLAELAIALVGFAGVAAAFAGRERAFRATERVRLVTLFLNSGLVLSGCAGVHILLLAELAPEIVFRTVSLYLAVLVPVASLPFLFQAYRFARDPDSTSEPWALYLTSAQVLIVLTLLSVNVLLATPHFLAGAFWLEILHGLWMFWRLLTRPN